MKSSCHLEAVKLFDYPQLINLNMVIRIILILFTLVISQDYLPIIFQVDMSNEIVSEDGVHIMGSDDSFLEFGVNLDTQEPFPAWNPSSISLTDNDGDNIFEATLYLLPNTSYLYKFVNGDSFGDDEDSNRVYESSDLTEILEPVCFNSPDPCSSFDGTQLSSITFSTDLNNAIANNGFTLGDMLIVRWGYAGTQLTERTDTLSAQGFGTGYSITIDAPEANLENGLYYQYYKIIDNIQYREIYFNFDFNGEDQNMAERRFYNFEDVIENDNVNINDNVNSNVDSRRRPLFMNTDEIGEDVTITWEVDMRPAYYQVYSGSTLYDIQGVLDVSNYNQVYELGVWMNGPATFFANGEDWTSWGLTLANTESKRMWDDGTNGDQVAGDHIYTIQLDYDAESTFGQEFKLGIGGGDNESGYGLNHIENINIQNPIIRSYWGSINPLFYDAWDYDLNEPTIEVCSGVLGDSNLDNEVNILDIVTIVDYIVSSENLIGDSYCNSDVNSDISVDILDIVLIVTNILEE